MVGCSKSMDIDKPIGIDVITTPMPGKQVVVEGHGRETFFAIGPIGGVGEARANGVASLHGFEDGATIVSVQANIAVPEDGKFLEAWMADGGGKPVVSLGHLTNAFNDVRHSVRYETPKDLRAYSKIVITEEGDDGDPSPSLILAEGLLKANAR
ncbi:MAG: hypothetical protein G01um101425_1030 [Candidatus Peregrinibacteria bacterium Gr01-1014_25]|nr:MAG: hypothetical protein G01um101425_1030 [Candidatus Peregrinibacteria bacterium Gr01-1014_25]